MNRIVLSSHFNRDLFKGCIRRVVSIILMLVLAGGSGSPVFARSLVEPLAVLNEQLTRLSQFAAALATSKRHATAQEILEDRGMPPNPPASAAIRPEPPQARSVREARVARLVLNLGGGVTLAPGESVQLMAVPEDDEGNTVHGVVAEWQSLNSQAVVVTKEGEATAVAAGVAPVTATIGQTSTTLLLTVVPKLSASANTDQSKSAPQLARKLRGRTQQASRNSSLLFAHAPSGTAMPLPLPLGIGDAEPLYDPNNAVGAPPGRTTPGAST